MAHWAWRLVEDSRIERKELDLARRAGDRAVELEPENPYVLETRAAIDAARGDLAGAIAWQERAIAHLDRIEDERRREELKAELRERLAGYRAELDR